MEGEESQAAAPRLSLCATRGTGWCASLAPGQLQEGCSPGSDGSPNSRLGGGPVSGALSPPGLGQAAVQKWSQASVRAAHMGGRRQKGCAVHMAHPSAFPKGQRCVWWVHVWGPKGCWELLSRAISWQCPCSKDMTAPDRGREGETCWCNPAGPLALGMGYLG